MKIYLNQAKKIGTYSYRYEDSFIKLNYKQKDYNAQLEYFVYKIAKVCNVETFDYELIEGDIFSDYRYNTSVLCTKFRELTPFESPYELCDKVPNLMSRLDFWYISFFNFCIGNPIDACNLFLYNNTLVPVDFSRAFKYSISTCFLQDNFSSFIVNPKSGFYDMNYTYTLAILNELKNKIEKDLSVNFNKMALFMLERIKLIESSFLNFLVKHYSNVYGKNFQKELFGKLGKLNARGC